MTIIDANLLLYAYNADAPQQKASARWLQKLLESDEIVGLPLVTDAVLAALAIEHGALLASTDQDFRRFPELRWQNPLSP